MDIVSLIEDNPITRLSGTYQSKLLEKVKVTFTDDEQQMFVTSYYCYLNFHTTNDFVIDLDNIWKWIGFATKQKAKELLYKQFILDKDYQCALNLKVKQKPEGRGGHNKETIMLNIKTFKLFCMKAGTKKADLTHEYYVKLEELLHEVVQEETVELRLQLENHKNIQERSGRTLFGRISNNIPENDVGVCRNIANIANNEKERIREKTILEQFPRNTQCVYYGFIDNTNGNNESLIKFGHSNDLPARVDKHKRTFEHFRLMNAFRVENRTQIENAMKQHSILKQHRRTLEIKEIHYTEILGNITPVNLDKIVQDIITQIEYSPENYKKLWDKSQNLTTENQHLKQTVKKLSKENHRIKREYQEHLHNRNSSVETMNTQNCEVNSLIPPVSSHLSKALIERKHLRKFQRHADGKFYIDGNIYKELTGTREQVWDRHAYRTSGELIREDFIINQEGKIVSKKKSILSKIDIRPICKPRIKPIDVPGISP